MRAEGLPSSGFPEGSGQMGNVPPNRLENLPDNTPLFLGPQGRPVREKPGGSPCQSVPGEKHPILRPMCLNNVRQPWRTQMSCFKAEAEASRAKAS